MMMISLVITDPLQLSTVRRTHRPGSRHFHLLRDNRRLHCESLVVGGKYLLDLPMGTMSMIYIERSDVVLLERNVMRISGRRFQKASSKWFLDLALQRSLP
jgi:hypothetical protein